MTTPEKLLKNAKAAQEALLYAKLLGSEPAIHAAHLRCQAAHQALMDAMTPQDSGMIIATWPNGSDETAPGALRYLAEHGTSAYGGSHTYNDEHLYQIAYEIDRFAAQPLFQQTMLMHDKTGLPEAVIFQPVQWKNDCHRQSVSALRYFADGYSSRKDTVGLYTPAQLVALAKDIADMASKPFYTHKR